MKNALILTTQSGDWEALYVDGKLIIEGHTIEDGDRFFIWKKGIELGFTPNNIYTVELDNKDEEYTMENGNMPDDISKYLITHITKDCEFYKCMVCGKVYKASDPLPTIGVADGCCTVGSLIEIKDEEFNNIRK